MGVGCLGQRHSTSIIAFVNLPEHEGVICDGQGLDIWHEGWNTWYLLGTRRSIRHILLRNDTIVTK